MGNAVVSTCQGGVGLRFLLGSSDQSGFGSRCFLGPGFEISAGSRGSAVGDYDNDGDLDILVNNVMSTPTLLRNEGGNRENWLVLELSGKQQRDALGTRVVVTSGGLKQVRERQSGGSYLSSHDHRLHFGLADALFVDVEIYWPDGTEQRLRDIRANHLVKIRQGQEVKLLVLN